MTSCFSGVVLFIVLEILQSSLIAGEYLYSCKDANDNCGYGSCSGGKCVCMGGLESSEDHPCNSCPMGYTLSVRNNIPWCENIAPRSEDVAPNHFALYFGKAGANFNARSVVQTTSGDYLFTGELESLVLGKVAADGSSIKWSKVSSYGAVWNFKVLQVVGGKYLVIGYMRNANNNIDTCLTLWNEDGSLQWGKTYNSGSWEYLFSGIQTADLNIVTIGQFYNASVQSRMLLSKWDTNGVHLWSKTFANYTSGTSVIEVDEGNLIAVGVIRYTFTDFRLLVTKWSSTGVLLWAKSLESAKTIADYVQVARTTDGNFVVAGASRVTKWNQDGELLWSSYLEENVAGGLVATPDGGVVVSSTYMDAFLVAKWDAAGNQGWMLKGAGTGTSGQSLTSTSDGGFLMGGFTGSTFALTVKIPPSLLLPGCSFLVNASSPFTLISQTPLNEAAAIESVSMWNNSFFWVGNNGGLSRYSSCNPGIATTGTTGTSGTTAHTIETTGTTASTGTTGSAGTTGSTGSTGTNGSATTTETTGISDTSGSSTTTETTEISDTSGSSTTETTGISDTSGSSTTETTGISDTNGSSTTETTGITDTTGTVGTTENSATTGSGVTNAETTESSDSGSAGSTGTAASTATYPNTATTQAATQTLDTTSDVIETSSSSTVSTSTTDSTLSQHTTQTLTKEGSTTTDSNVSQHSAQTQSDEGNSTTDAISSITTDFDDELFPEDSGNGKNSTKDIFVIVISTIAAIVACCGLIVGGLFIWKFARKQKHVDVEEAPVNLSLEPRLPQRFEKTRTVIEAPSGRRYALYNKVSVDDSARLFEQTGIEVRFATGVKKSKFMLGQGQFGKLKLAMDERSGTFVGVKKIKGNQQIRESAQEGIVQKELSGIPHLMPLLDSVDIVGSQGEKVLYQFMPLAGFGNGRFLRDKLMIDSSNKERILLHVAKAIVEAMRSMHRLGYYHLDIKPDNFVLDKEGNVYIIDFGCTRKLENNWISNGGKGDVRYCSPERIAHFRSIWKKQGNHSNVVEVKEGYHASIADAWGVGITLLELYLGRYPFDVPTPAFVTFMSTWDSNHFTNELENIAELRNPNNHGLLKLIKDMLVVDLSQRADLDRVSSSLLLQNQVFASQNEQQAVFEALKRVEVSVDAHDDYGNVPEQYGYNT